MKKSNREIIFISIVLLLGVLIGCASTSYAPGEAPSDLLVNRKWQVVSGVFGNYNLPQNKLNIIYITNDTWIEKDINGATVLSGDIIKLTDDKITVKWDYSRDMAIPEGHTPYFYKVDSDKLMFKLYRDGKVFGTVKCELVGKI